MVAAGEQFRELTIDSVEDLGDRGPNLAFIHELDDLFAHRLVVRFFLSTSGYSRPAPPARAPRVFRFDERTNCIAAVCAFVY